MVPDKLVLAVTAVLLRGALVVGLAACTDNRAEFYPLEPGRWWYFRTQTTILDEHSEQRFIVSNLGQGERDGKPIFIQRQSTGRDVYISRDPEGAKRVGVGRGAGRKIETDEPILILPANPALGDTWSTDTRLTLIESRTFARQDKLRGRTLPLRLSMSIAATNDTVRVPAGQFDGCPRVEGTGTRQVRTDRGNASAQVEVTHLEWYAPGIGLVKSVRSETSESPFLKAGEYKQVLLQFER